MQELSHSISIRPILSIQEVGQCVAASLERYSDQEQIITVDPETAMNNAVSMFNSGAMFLVAILDNKIIAWIVATTTPASMHSKEKCLSQMYYHSKVDGALAVRAMRLCHAAMVQYAAERGIPLVKSGSYLQNSSVFTRILKAEGWTVIGDTAIRRVPARTPPEGSRLLVRCRPVAG